MLSAQGWSLHCCVLLLRGNTMSGTMKLSEVWQGLWSLAPTQAVNSQKHGEERGKGKTDGAVSRHTDQKRQTLLRRNLQSKYDCASHFCATFPKRDFPVPLSHIATQKCMFGCPRAEQREVKIILSAALQIWARSTLSSFCGGEGKP